MSDMSTLKFTGETASGEMDLNVTKMVCVPSKPHYAEVDLCLKDGMNVVIGQVVGSWLSFDEKKKLGYEIERRWNRQDPMDKLVEWLESRYKNGYEFLC